MALTLVYRRKTAERKEVTLDNVKQLGTFVYTNQPLDVIAVREASEEERSK